MVDSGGELVIGSFSTENATQKYMEIIGEWILRYRSSQQLIDLAEDCEINRELIRVGKETEGVNLFLHLAKNIIRDTMAAR